MATGIKHFTFEQLTPSAAWVIDHNLGHHPVVDVVVDYNGGRQKILPLSIIYNTANRLTVNFTMTMSGSAQLC